MKKEVDIAQGCVVNKWFRLGCSVTLALILALVILFVPIRAGKVIHLPVPMLPPPVVESLSASTDGYAGGTIDLRLPLGAELVRATNGLTITKTAGSAAVDQGGVLTYTLVITNRTGVNLTDITVVDSVP